MLLSFVLLATTRGRNMKSAKWSVSHTLNLHREREMMYYTVQLVLLLTDNELAITVHSALMIFANPMFSCSRE